MPDSNIEDPDFRYFFPNKKLVNKKNQFFNAGLSPQQFTQRRNQISFNYQKSTPKNINLCWENNSPPPDTFKMNSKN